MNEVSAMSELNLGFNLKFNELYELSGLEKVDEAFLGYLKSNNAELADKLLAGRTEKPDAKDESQILIDAGPYLENFLAELFGIETELTELNDCHHALKPFFDFKRTFIQRKAFKAVTAEAAAQIDGEEMAEKLGKLLEHPYREPKDEMAFVEKVSEWLEDPEANAEALELATNYAGWALRTPEGREKHAAGHLFKLPGKLDFERLVPAEMDTTSDYAVHKLPDKRLHRREGFKLTDHGKDLKGALSEAHYCIYCHNQGKDSCAKGLKPKSKEGEKVGFNESPFGVALTGCPLGVRISEMNILKAQGSAIGSLAALVVENPMTAGTGHRICNECMKACVYQKQDPVDIPEIETRILKDVLALPYGFEI